MCQEGKELKAFGSGLLSSFGELEYCVGQNPDQKPTYAPFDPDVTALTKYPITSYQPLYYIAQSFQDAKKKMTDFVRRNAAFNRGFDLRYNPLTQSVEILDNVAKIVNVVSSIETELEIVKTSLRRLGGLN